MGIKLVKFRNISISFLIFANTAYAQMSSGLPPINPKSGLKPTAAQTTQTKTIEILGQRVTFANPSGYCTLGESARERDLMLGVGRFQDGAQGNTGSLDTDPIDRPQRRLQKVRNGTRSVLDRRF